MKAKNLLFCTLFFCCALGIQTLNAQLVEKASITANEANFKMISPNSYLMEIAGPNDYYFRQEIESTNNISISNVDSNGKKFPDGTYKMQVTPIVTLSETIRQELADLRKENDQEKIAAFRTEHELPSAVNVYNIAFSIQNGKFISPDQEEARGLNLPSTSMMWEQQDHPVLYAALNNVDIDYGKPVWTSNALPLATDNTLMIEDDQQFLDDVIVGGSICVGLDCNNGESFGFDTGRFKENNLRVHFDDTSTSASFPSNDWRITINDSSNGGSSYFAVEDATAGNVPFRIEAGAGANALHVDNSGGNVGLGTATPVVELHVADGDSPTMRLEQNGASGFTPQTWDLAGNETNFFVRDVTNGSLLPFRIRPSAPTNSIYIDNDGDVGMGTNSPSAELHVRRTDGSAQLLVEEVGSTTASRTLLTLKNNGGPAIAMENTSTSEQWFLTHENNSPNRFLIASTATVPAGSVFSLENNGDLTITGTLTTGGVTCGGGCDLVFQPSKYTVPSIEEHAAYMWKNSFLKAVGPTPEGAPMNVSEKVGGILNELEHAHIYIEQLNNDIKAQKEKIENLEAQIAKMETLETQLAELSQLVSSVNKTNDSSDSSDKADGEKE